MVIAAERLGSTFLQPAADGLRKSRHSYPRSMHEREPRDANFVGIPVTWLLSQGSHGTQERIVSLQHRQVFSKSCSLFLLAQDETSMTQLLTLIAIYKRMENEVLVLQHEL